MSQCNWRNFLLHGLIATSGNPGVEEALAAGPPSPGISQHDVRRLQVGVNDPLAVQMGKAPQDVVRDQGRLCL